MSGPVTTTPEKPTALALQASNIPSCLTKIPHWVLWRYRLDGERWTKPPYQVSGRLAKPNDSATWLPFEPALTAYQKGQFDGIGWNIAPGFVGIDIDKVIASDGAIDKRATAILDKFQNTYCELSPSGNGYRIFAYGTFLRSGKGTDWKGIEVYTPPSNRYLTLTGHAIAASEVTNQQAALDWLYETHFAAAEPATPAAQPATSHPVSVDTRLELALRNATIEKLYGGGTAGYASASEGDIALCLLLMTFADGNTTTVDRWFRGSKRMRAKWNERRGERTYGELTLSAALAKWDGQCFKAQHQKSTDTREKVADGATPADTDLNPYRGTDTANAELFLHLHGQDMRYCPPWEKWLIWSGSHWRIDDDLKVSSLVADLPLHLYQQAGKTADSTQRRQIAGLAHKLEKRNVQNDALALARCRVVVRHTDLDQGHYLLNASNGTVDLHTGAIRRHERADLLTHDVEVPYAPTATAATWRAFLQSTFAGDADLIQFVQRAIGYSLTGDVREQVLFICHGVGSNGKSVFLNILRKLLGRLAIQAAPDLLMQDKQRRHPTEQADLFSKRLVVCQETGEGRRFNETLVKQLTGGDGIRARRMHEDFWEFSPTHKLWLSTNHKPEIRGTDHAIWRRIRLIPFNVKFTDNGPARKDPEMEAKLTAELPGILTWAVQGCLDWQRIGLQPPTAVTEATAQYQSEMDVLAAWMNDCCVVKRHCEAKAADLYQSYTAWCEQSGEYPEKQRKFGMRLKERGFERYSGNHGYAYWRGIGIKSCVDDVDHVDKKRQFFEPFSTREKNCQTSSTSSTSSTPQESDDLSSHLSPVSVEPG